MPRRTDPYAPTKSQRQRRGRKLESKNANTHTARGDGNRSKRRSVS